LVASPYHATSVTAVISAAAGASAASRHRPGRFSARHSISQAKIPNQNTASLAFTFACSA
jgi:hypothetical protein